MADVSSLKIELVADKLLAGLDKIESKLDNLASDANKAQKSLEGMARSGKSSLGGISSAAGLAAGAAAGLAAALVLGAKSVIDINSQYQKLQANLVTVSGSTEKAAAQFKALQQFAAKTPFSLEEVTKAFTAMQAYGLSTSEETLAAFGNIAGGMGKGVQDVVEAVADAANGEFERLKAFSIKATKQGDNIAFRFKGVTTTVKNNAEDIQKYIEGIGNKDFAGGMARQAATIDGAWSNLTDNIKNSIAELGTNTGLNAFVTDFVNGLNTAIDETKLFFSVIGDNSAVQSIGATISGIIKSVMDFMNTTVTVGGVTTTVWGQIGVAVYDAVSIISSAVDFIIKGFAGIAQAASEYIGQVVKLWQGFFGTGIGKWTTNFLLTLVNNFEAAVKVIGNGFMQIPKIIFQAFAAGGTIANSFFSRLKSLMGGNIKAFDGFWAEAGAAASKPLTTATNFATTSFKAFDVAAKDSANNVLTVGREIGEVHKQNMARITEAKKKASEKPKVDMSALNTRTQGDGGTSGTSKADKEAAKKAEEELKKYQERLKSLTDTYAPAVKRSQEWNQAQIDLTRAIGLGDEGLRKYGLTVDKVKEIMAAAQETLGKGFFDKAKEDVLFENATIKAGEFSDAASVAAEKVRQIAKAAKDAHEVLTPAQEKELQGLIQINEETRKSVELRTKVKEANKDLIKDTSARIQDLKDEASLLGMVGKERERAQELLYFKTDAARSGADIDTQTKAIEGYTKALDELEAKRESLNTFGQGLKNAITEYTESAADVANNAASSMNRVFSSLEDNLADSIKKGKLSFKGFLGTIADELAKFAAQQTVALFLKFFTGGGLGSLFGGFFADGGSPPVGKVSVVGEKSAEVFVPKQAGNVLNQSQLRALGVGSNSGSGGGSSSVNMSMTVNITGGTDGDIQSQLNEFGTKLTNDINKEIINQRRHGGSMRGIK